MAKSSLACSVQKCLGQLWGNDDFSDFTVVVEGKKYACHKFLLRACFGFFDGLLRSNSQKDCVELSEMTSDIFDIIINSVYRGIDGLTQENLVSVWKAVYLLQINFLVTECEEFVIKYLSLDNYLEFYDCAKLLQSERVVRFSLDVMISHFYHFRGTKTFLDLTAEELYMMVKSHNLNIKSEELVIKSILRWVSHVPLLSSVDLELVSKNLNTKSKMSLCSEEVSDESVKEEIDVTGDSLVNKNKEFPSNSGTASTSNQQVSHVITRKAGGDGEDVNDTSGELPTTDEHSIRRGNQVKDTNRVTELGKLLNAARVCLLEPEYIQTLMNNPIISNNNEAMTVLFNAYFYQQKAHHDYWPPSAVHRACSDMTHAMVYVDGQSKQCKLYSLNNGLTHVLCAYPAKGNTPVQSLYGGKVGGVGAATPIFTFATQPNASLKKITLGTSDQMLFLGESSPTINNKWETHIHMWEKTFGWRLAAGSMNIKLRKFLSHGQQFYMLCENPQDKFEFCLGKIRLTTFECPVFIKSVVSCKKNILLMMPSMRLNTLTSVSCYNSQKREKTILKDLAGPPKNILSFQCQENVYILQSNGKLRLVITIDHDKNIDDYNDHSKEDNVNPHDVADTDSEPNKEYDKKVFFQFVAKLWNFDWKPYGAVVYKDELFIFGSPTSHFKTWVKSVPDNPDFKTIKYIKIDSLSECLPMTVPKSWLK